MKIQHKNKTNQISPNTVLVMINWFSLLLKNMGGGEGNLIKRGG